jgi:hypothetical protein
MKNARGIVAAIVLLALLLAVVASLSGNTSQAQDVIRVEQAQASLAAHKRFVAGTQDTSIAMTNVLTIGGAALLLVAGTAICITILRHATGVAYRERSAIEHAHQTEMAHIRATRDIGVAMTQPQFPGLSHYHPTITYGSGNARQIAPIEQAIAEVEAEGSGVPSFAKLLNAGAVGRGSPLLLGIGTAGELAGSWLDLYSTAVGGLPGSGKSTSQRFFACQTVLHGARFVVCDPHYGTSEDSLGASLSPLEACFDCDIADTEERILEAVRFVDSIGKARLKNSDRRPLILWIDETTALLNNQRVGTALAALMEEIARQYRKVGVYLSASGQIWLSSRSGGSSALRDSFASVLAHRMKRSQARLLLPTDDAKVCERLATGQAVLYRTSGESEIISIPYTSVSDVRRVAGLLPDNLPTMPNMADPKASWKPDDSQRVARDEECSISSQCKPPSAEAARVRALFLDGMSLAEIVQTMRGVKSSEGRRYQTALKEIQGLLRDAMTG